MGWKDENGYEEPPFIKLYLDDLSRLNDLTGVQRAVLGEIMRFASYGNEINITKKLKIEMLSNIGVANSSFKNALNTLVNKDIIARGHKRGIYIINPKLAFKGKVNDRASLIIKYNSLGKREITLEVSSD